MHVLRVSFKDNGICRTLFIIDPTGASDVLPWVYSAAGEVHIPIGPGAYDCKFEKAEIEEVINVLKENCDAPAWNSGSN